MEVGRSVSSVGEGEDERARSGSFGGATKDEERGGSVGGGREEGESEEFCWCGGRGGNCSEENDVGFDGFPFGEFDLGGTFGLEGCRSGSWFAGLDEG